MQLPYTTTRNPHFLLGIAYLCALKFLRVPLLSE